MLTEADEDKLLGIRTSGRDDSASGEINFPYEPTDYCVLERLAYSGFIRKKNCVLDYGCGKGRVGFYLSYQTHCRVIGIDYDRRMIASAAENLQHFKANRDIRFLAENAARYEPDPSVDRIYFFNPFAEKVLGSALSRIEESYYRNPRDILLFFYYPSDAYVANMMTDDRFSFLDEIPCGDLFQKEDPRERILIFEYR